jgi:hypothetical protein
MKRNVIAFAFTLVLVIFLAGINSQAYAQTYTSFDADPHATLPSHIDSTGRIIGQVFHADQKYGGFIRNTDGSIIDINYPYAISTDWIGFAGSNQIVEATPIRTMSSTSSSARSPDPTPVSTCPARNKPR